MSCLLYQLLILFLISLITLAHPPSDRIEVARPDHLEGLPEQRYKVVVGPAVKELHDQGPFRFHMVDGEINRQLHQQRNARRIRRTVARQVGSHVGDHHIGLAAAQRFLQLRQHRLLAKIAGLSLPGAPLDK